MVLYVPAMRRRLIVITCCAGACLTGVIALYLLFLNRSNPEQTTRGPFSTPNKEVRLGARNAAPQIPNNIPRTPAETQSPSAPSTESDLLGELQRLRRDLNGGLSHDRAKEALEQMRQRVQAHPQRTEAIEQLTRFLDSGLDASTGLGFQVGQNHALRESPTLRTSVLDWLGQLDPAAASEYSMKILEVKESPSEWAVTLRNYAHGPNADMEFLETKTVELLHHEPWLREPSEGYLEAFDTAVFIGSQRFLSEFATLLENPPHPALKHGSLMALDRLVIRNPGPTLNLLANGELLETEPFIRAGLMARADVRNPGQRTAVEKYLARNDVSAEEFDKFAKLFPNAHGFLSHNLLTDKFKNNLRDSAERDLASLEQIHRWQDHPEFAPHLDRFKDSKERLQRFVESAVRGKLLPPATLSAIPD